MKRAIERILWGGLLAVSVMLWLWAILLMLTE